MTLQEKDQAKDNFVSCINSFAHNSKTKDEDTSWYDINNVNTVG